MPRMDLRFSVRFLGKGHSTVLMIALGLYLFVLYPLLAEHEVLLTVLRAAFMIVLFSACYAVAASRRAFRLAVALALLTAASTWSGQLFGGILLIELSRCFAVLFFLWVALLLLRHVLEGASVTLDRLFGAVCIYMIFGLMWAEIFTLLHGHNPNAFVFGEQLAQSLGGSRPGGESDIFIYYSFVTLTTLGYGDITPASTGARAMSALEAIVGPLYLAILIARLVSQMDARASRTAS